MKSVTLLSAVLIGLSSTAAFADDVVVASTSTETLAPASIQRTCLRDTGSRIPSRSWDDCVAAHGTVYNQADIEGGGATTAGQSLYRLDPALFIRGSRR